MSLQSRLVRAISYKAGPQMPNGLDSRWKPYTPPQDASGADPVGPNVLRMTNQQVDLLAQRIAYWNKRTDQWADYGRKLEFKATQSINTSVAASRVLAGDSRRVGVIFSSSSTQAYSLWINASVTTPTGIHIAANANYVEFWWERHGKLPASEWWVISTGVGAFSIIETLATTLTY